MTYRESAGMTYNTAFFSPENLARLKEIMYESKVQAGSHLYWEGDPADKMYFLQQGLVRIAKFSNDGRQLTMCVHQAGDLFGQIDIFQKSAHSFSAEAIENSVVGVFQQKDLEVLLWRHGELAIEFMKWMGLMHRQTQTKLRDLMLLGKPAALCSLLIRLSNMYGVKQGDQIFITQKLTHAEMAEMIATTRESVNRILSDLKKQGVLTYDDGHIIIEDLEFMRELCHCENCPKEICRI